MSLPSLGNKVIIDSLCDGGRVPIAQLNSHALCMYGPVIFQSFLYTLYGIPSEPGAESVHVFKAVNNSSSVNSFSIYSFECVDSFGQFS